MKGFSVIVAHDAERGIGLNNDLPWKLPQDLQNFKMLTTNSGDWLPPAVLMGSRTWESLPVKPLKDRVNAVVSNKYSYIKGATVFKGFGPAIMSLCNDEDCGEVFVIGGAGLYTPALEHPMLQTLYITEVEGKFGCDRFFPEYLDIPWYSKEEGEWKYSPEAGLRYRFVKYLRALYA